MVKKIFREIDLFDFTSFFGQDFFKFSGPLCICAIERNFCLKKLIYYYYFFGNNKNFVKSVFEMFGRQLLHRTPNTDHLFHEKRICLSKNEYSVKISKPKIPEKIWIN